MGETNIVLTATECAHVLKMSTATLFKLVKAGKVPVIRINTRKMLFSVKEIEKLMSSDNFPGNSKPSGTAAAG